MHCNKQHVEPQQTICCLSHKDDIIMHCVQPYSIAERPSVMSKPSKQRPTVLLHKK